MPEKPVDGVSNAAKLGRALGCGVVIGLVPIVFFGLTMLPRVMRSGDSTATVMVLAAMFVGALFFGLPVAILVYVMQQRAAVRRPSLTDAYRGFAEQVGGEAKFQQMFFGLELPKEVRFQHKGRMAVLDLPPIHESGPSSRGSLRMRLELAQPTRLTCQIFPQGLLSPLGSVFGVQDALLGWDVFDDHFVVKTNDPTAAAAVFDRPVQEWLLRFQSFADQHLPPKHLGAGYFDLSLADQKFQIRMQALMLSEAALMDFYHACAEICDLVESRLERLD